MINLSEVRSSRYQVLTQWSVAAVVVIAVAVAVVVVAVAVVVSVLRTASRTTFFPAVEQKKSNQPTKNNKCR